MENQAFCINGFLYFQDKPQAEAAPPPAWLMAILLRLVLPVGEIERTSEVNLREKIWLRDLRRWDEERRPHFDRTHAELGAADLGAMSAVELSAFFERCFANFEATVYNHYEWVFSFMYPVGARKRRTRGPAVRR